MGRSVLEPPNIETVTPPQVTTSQAATSSAPRVWQTSRENDANGLKLVVGGLIALGLCISLLVAVFANVGGHSGATSASSSGSNAQPASMGGGGSAPVSQATYKAPDHQLFDASAPAAPAGNSVDVKLTVQESVVSIAQGVAYRAWTFNGTVPGPVIRVREGQTVNFTLVNSGTMGHSIDFHAADTPWSVNYQEVAAGKSFSFTWKAMHPGVFMYHCGTPPVIEHIANGMYGTIIVDPASGWAPADEYVVTQSEFYTVKQADGSYGFDMTKAMAVQPDYVVFNGYANQYKGTPLTAHAGKRIRLFVMNAGPSNFSAFHVIGAMFDKTFMDGNPANLMVGNQTVTLPPGGGAVFELVIPEAGLYPFLTHSFADASKGALGVIKVEP